MKYILTHLKDFAEIKTVIALTAFLVTLIIAFVAKVNRNKLKRDRELIEAAPDKKRAELIEQIIGTWGLSARKFNNEQKFELINLKEKQNERRFYFTISLSFLMILLSGYFIYITTLENKIDEKKVKQIVLMDSPLKDVVYSYAGWEMGRTNADEITTILREITHFDIIKENTSLEWNREDELFSMKPDLIIIHASCFYNKTNTEDADRKFFSFLSYISELETKIIIYSRGFHHEQIWLDNLFKDMPKLKNKVQTLIVKQGNDFNNAVVRRDLKMKVKNLLNI
ncbi:MAG: hypothetical protein V4620_04480 [Bacteroidota bacterium]